jgi:hypothetical protein
MKMLEEMIRLSALDENLVRSEFAMSKANVLRVLKTYAFKELKEEMEKEEEILTRPKEPRKPREKKVKEPVVKTEQ